LTDYALRDNLAFPILSVIGFFIHARGITVLFPPDEKKPPSPTLEGAFVKKRRMCRCIMALDAIGEA
jgi:hypothetical protein